MRKIKNQIGIALLVAALAAGCARDARPKAFIQKAGGGELPIQIEIADTPAKRERGLMFRPSVPEGTGMLFLFPRETRTPFWMKNTPAPLDMIFIRDGRIVSLIENAVPYSEDILTPDSSYTMVLEVAGGYVARHGIHVKDGFKVEGKIAVPTS